MIVQTTPGQASTPPYRAYATIMGTFMGGLAIAWVAAGLGTTQILAPRFGRILTWSLAAAGANDWLQAGFSALTSKCNELEQKTIAS